MVVVVVVGVEGAGQPSPCIRSCIRSLSPRSHSLGPRLPGCGRQPRAGPARPSPAARTPTISARTGWRPAAASRRRCAALDAAAAAAALSVGGAAAQRLLGRRAVPCPAGGSANLTDQVSFSSGSSLFLSLPLPLSVCLSICEAGGSANLPVKFRANILPRLPERAGRCQVGGAALTTTVCLRI